MLRSGLPLSSASAEWATPSALFREWDAEFGFTLDVAASDANAKCQRYYTAAQDGLALPWAGEVVWCNPPYGGQLGAWVERAAEAALHERATVALLVPARTDVRWWHAHVWDAVGRRPRPGVEIRFLEGRLRFQDSKGGRAPFPTVLVVFRPIEGAAG